MVTTNKGSKLVIDGTDTQDLDLTISEEELEAMRSK